MQLPAEIAAKLQELGISQAPLTEHDREAFDLERLEAANSKQGELGEINCPKCKNRGYTYTLGEQGVLITHECECMVRRRNIRRLRASGLMDMVARYTFDTWASTEKWQTVALEIAQDYVASRSGWLLASGNSGSGKTHLCTAVCGALLDAGVDARYVLWRDMSVQAKAVVNDDEAYQRLISPLKKTKLLYIDDLFKTGGGVKPSTADIRLAFEILNSRYNDSAKLTVISTEWSLDYLIDFDEALGSRIYERSKKHYINFAGRPNWRLQT